MLVRRLYVQVLEKEWNKIAVYEMSIDKKNSDHHSSGASPVRFAGGFAGGVARGFTGDSMMSVLQ